VPTTSGKLTLTDFDNALIVRGFDAFQQQERYQLINLGYRAVARSFPYLWAETSQTYVATAGNPIIVQSLNLPNSIDSIRRMYCVTDPYRRKMQPETEERFVERWLSLDLTNPQNQGIPYKYFYWADNVYVLPAPRQALSFTIWFYQYLPDLLQPGDVSAMPQVMDEIVIDAALVRAHRRAHELQLAGDAQSRVDDAINAMLQDDVWAMEELQERVLPDDQWW
jgi:hypothetical protein